MSLIYNYIVGNTQKNKKKSGQKCSYIRKLVNPSGTTCHITQSTATKRKL